MSSSEVDDYAMSQDESDGYEPEVTKKVPCHTQGATKRRINMGDDVKSEHQYTGRGCESMEQPNKPWTRIDCISPRGHPFS